MEAVAIQSAEEDVRGFIEEYFASWTGADEHDNSRLLFGRHRTPGPNRNTQRKDGSSR